MVAYTAVRVETLTYQSCPDTKLEKQKQVLRLRSLRRPPFRMTALLSVVLSHPSRNNKNAARVGHPDFHARSVSGGLEAASTAGQETGATICGQALYRIFRCSRLESIYVRNSRLCRTQEGCSSHY